MPIPLPAIVFIAVLAVSFGTYWLLILRPEQEQQRALKKRLSVKRESLLKDASAGLLKQTQKLSEMPFFDRLLSQTSRISAPLQRRLSSTGLKMTVGTLLLLSATCGLA